MANSRVHFWNHKLLPTLLLAEAILTRWWEARTVGVSFLLITHWLPLFSISGWRLPLMPSSTSESKEAPLRPSSSSDMSSQLVALPFPPPTHFPILVHHCPRKTLLGSLPTHLPSAWVFQVQAIRLFNTNPSPQYSIHRELPYPPQLSKRRSWSWGIRRPFYF